MDDYQEPDEFYGIPIEQFASEYLLNQLERDDIPYLRTIVLCKLYDLHEGQITEHQQYVSTMLDGFRGTNRESQRCDPK